MLTEFDYYQHTGRQRKTGLGWLKREGAGGGFFAGASNQIFLPLSKLKKLIFVLFLHKKFFQLLWGGGGGGGQGDGKTEPGTGFF